MKATDVVIGDEYDWRHRVDGKPWRVRVVEVGPGGVRHETVEAAGGPPRWVEGEGRFEPCRAGNRMWEPLGTFRSGFRPVAPAPVLCADCGRDACACPRPVEPRGWWEA
jgi:hypothetical protein